MCARRRIREREDEKRRARRSSAHEGLRRAVLYPRRETGRGDAADARKARRDVGAVRREERKGQGGDFRARACAPPRGQEGAVGRLSERARAGRGAGGDTWRFVLGGERYVSEIVRSRARARRKTGRRARGTSS